MSPLFSPPKLAKEVRETLSLVEGHMEQELANSLFPVYLSLQAIHKDKAFLQKRSVIAQYRATRFATAFTMSLKLVHFKGSFTYSICKTIHLLHLTTLFALDFSLDL